MELVCLNFPDRYEHLNDSSHVVLPSSFLAQMYYDDSLYGYADDEKQHIYVIRNIENGKHTHCTVYEYDACDGVCHVPQWMMGQLGLSDFSKVEFYMKRHIPDGKKVCVKGQSCDYLEIEDVKKEFESAFQKYRCLTVGDKITFRSQNTFHEFEIVELYPQYVVSTLNVDLEIEFEEPLGYEEWLAKKEEEKKKKEKLKVSRGPSSLPRLPTQTQKSEKFVAFSGSGNALGKK